MVVVRGWVSDEEEVAVGGLVRKAKGAVGVDTGAGDSSFVGGGTETRDWMRESRAALRACSWWRARLRAVVSWRVRRSERMDSGVGALAGGGMVMFC